MLQSIKVCGYRSLREFRLKLARVTVITGGNGVGKSNVYRSLTLLQLCLKSPDIKRDLNAAELSDGT